jgi:hypothetical protein
MTKTPGAKAKAKTFMPPDERLKPVCVRLTDAQKKKFMLLGSGPWLREKLRKTSITL